MKMTGKETRIFSITLASWGIIMITSGLIMNASITPIINTEYKLSVSQKRVAQSKTNEIKLKDITIEVNNPLSVDVKDYLESIDQLDNTVLKALKLDTSMVNVTQPGTYTYTISFKKKKYNGTITVKEKELPKVELILNYIKIEVGASLIVPNESNNYDYSTYIKNTLTDEVKANIILDLSKVDTTKPGIYDYTVSYNKTTYTGKVEVYYPKPGGTIITPNTTTTNCKTENGKYYNKDGQEITKEQYEDTTICPKTQ